MKKYFRLQVILCIVFIAAGKLNSYAQQQKTIPLVIPASLKIKDTVAAPPEATLLYTTFSEEEMKKQWSLFNEDKGWKALVQEAEAKGFKKIDKSAWGFKGKLKDPVSGKTEDAMFCAYDFYSPSAKADKSFQTCSMIWRKVGKDVYKAYIIFPKGESSREKSFDGAEEWFVDENAKIQKAHSFNKCFRKCINGGKHSVAVETIFGSINVSADCKSQCISGVAVCGGVTAILELASGGLGTPVLIATFGICSGVACGQCFAMCALGCQ